MILLKNPHCSPRLFGLFFSALFVTLWMEDWRVWVVVNHYLERNLIR